MNQSRTLNHTKEEFGERPIAITIICILGFVGAGLSVPLVFSEIASQIGQWFPPYSGFIALVSLVCMIGLWFIKKWAAYTYICLVALNQIVLLTMGRWNTLVLIIQAVIIIITLSYFNARVKSISYKLLRYLKKQIWTIIVAYMLGIHNFYREDDKTPDNIGIVIKNMEAQEDGTPKD